VTLRGDVHYIWVCGESGEFHVRFCELVEGEGFLEEGEFGGGVVVESARC